MNFYKKAMMAEGGEMPEYGQGGKMPQYQEGGMMDKGAQQLQMLKAAYDKAVDEGNREMVDKIESAVSEMMMSAKDDRVKEMLMDMFPGMGAPSMDKGGSFPDLNEDGDVTYADVLKGRGVDLDEDKMEIKFERTGWSVEERNKFEGTYEADSKQYKIHGKWNDCIWLEDL